MINWILDEAKNLNADQESTILYNKSTVSLQCLRNPYPESIGKVFTMRTSPEKAEEERLNRFRRSLDDKLPKLIKYKGEKFDTALLLEDVSLAYSSSDWRELIPKEYDLKFQSIDYVILFFPNQEKMVMGLVWKEKSQLYPKISQVPDNHRFRIPEMATQ
jgi:hypothetical protein